MSREQRLAEALVYLADTLVQDFDIVDVFYHLVETAPELLDVDEASLLLIDVGGDLQVMAATSEGVRCIELAQVQSRQGPCFDAFTSGTPVMVSLRDPDAARSWPSFVASVREAGFGSMAAIPMKLRDPVLGALNLFRVDDDALGEDVNIHNDRGFPENTLADVRELAAVIAARIVDRLTENAPALVDLSDHAAVHQATGMVAAQMGMAVTNALALLRAHAWTRDHLLVRVSRDVVARRLHFGGEVAGQAITVGEDRWS